MKYAVFESGGKQYKVVEGDILEVERLNDASKEFTTSNILLYVSDGVYNVGNPYVNGITIKGKILEHKKGKKIRVVKFKSKVRYRKTIGSRKLLTKIQIEKILESGSKEVPKRKVSSSRKTSVKK